MITERWFDCDLAVVDVETTGLDPKNDRVIEVGVVHMRGGEILESWGHLIDPERDIPDVVVQITGIQQSDVDGKPTFRDIIDELRSRLTDRVFVAYNLGFDSAFLKSEFDRARVPWPESPCLDPLVFAREFHKDAGSKRLGKVAERLGIELLEAHRAVNDAEVAGKVLYAFRDKLPPVLEDLEVLQRQWAIQQEQALAAQRRRRGAEVDDDDIPMIPMAALESDEGIILGPAYIYGSEPDPLRYFYSQLPEVGARRSS